MTRTTEGTTMTETMRFIAREVSQYGEVRESTIYPFGSWHWRYQWHYAFEKVAFEAEERARIR